MLLAQLLFNFYFILKELIWAFVLCVIYAYRWVMHDPIGIAIKEKDAKTKEKERQLFLEKIHVEAYEKALKRL